MHVLFILTTVYRLTNPKLNINIDTHIYELRNKNLNDLLYLCMHSGTLVQYGARSEHSH